MARIIETDVVVIGGGAAGAYAALTAHAEGLRVLSIVKGFMGRSGCSIFAGNLQLVNTQVSEEEEIKWLTLP
jgi:succinate dehydrogenase/fumarate reductase flavoprotein subunit